MGIPEYEKLGAFYLGRVHDLDQRRRLDDLVLYDSRDLVTHAVCVGMTGSGKTGLGITLLEEAAIDGIPALVIDPKGDLANLLLTFPELCAADFAPWVNEEDARRKGVTPEVYAQEQAALWKRGLAEWDQDGARIERLRHAADFVVYTPGSNAGLPVSVLKSFAAPPMEIVEDTEAFRERVTSTATSLLGLVGFRGDPLQSREHILLSALLGEAWAKGHDLDLPGLIHGIQSPPITRVGVMELETFYPAQERFGLAMQLNNLIASPGFARWMEGEPLDIGAMLHGPSGKPRVCIFSIAHLGDAERMFFVSLLFNQTLGWMRTQSGTSSLRAVLYMDEIAGYCPPVANPPAKQPLLTLMKQARAFGVGLVLATQNPVDLDYKGLANAGTWFIGRLQTERDKARLLDGLEGAAAGASTTFDRASIDRKLSQLGNRIFLVNNVHDDGPRIIETRWAMSYLRGPLTRAQIKTLMDPMRSTAYSEPQSTAASAPAAPTQPAPAKAPMPEPQTQPVASVAVERPVLPPEIRQFFVPVRGALDSGRLVYKPMLLACAKVYYADAKLGVDQDASAAYLAAIRGGAVPVDWDAALETELDESHVESEPRAGASFAPLPAEAGREKSYDAWKKGFVDMIYRAHRLKLLKSAGFKSISKAGESEREFRLRLVQTAREDRDAQVEKLRAKYAPKFATLQDRVRRTEQTVAVQQEQVKQAKVQTAVSFGSAILSAFLGRKVSSAGNVGRAATAVRGVGRSMRESSDVGRAEENVEAVKRQLADLEAQFQAEVSALGGKADPMTEELEPVALTPKKTNISVRAMVLAWAPHRIDAAGVETPAWN